MDSDSDGPEAPKPLTRTADIATPLSRMIRESIEFAYEHRSKFRDDPAEGSRAPSEFAKDTGSPSKHRRRDIEAAHESAAGIYILSTAYFLTALARLLGAEMELFASQAVARSAVECAAKAWWLDDVEASADERLARFYADNLENIDEMAKAKRLTEPELSRKRKELVQRAARSGIEPKLSKKTS
jgi:hypothetical protein